MRIYRCTPWSFRRLVALGVAISFIRILSVMPLFGEELTKQLSVSPDKRFTLVRIYVENDEDTPYVRIVEKKSGRNVGRIPKEGQAAHLDQAEFRWAPNGLRLAYTLRAGGRYISTNLYQFKGGAFVELASPEEKIGYAEIEQERLKRLEAAKMPKDVYQRRIWDTWRIKKWTANDVAELLVHSIRTCPIPDEDATFDLDLWIRYTLKFDAKGEWKVVKKHMLTDEEAKSETDE